MRKVISTDDAPAAIGTYSQAVQHDNLTFVSGQIPLVPDTMELVDENIDDQIRQVFANLSAILHAAGGSLADVLKFTVYLTNLDHFPRANEIMAETLSEPFPARAAIEVSALPKGSKVEIDAIAAIGPD